MTVYKHAGTISISQELLDDAAGWNEYAQDLRDALAEQVMNGHIGPMHGPSRDTLWRMEDAERSRKAARAWFLGLCNGRKPGTFRRAA